MMGRMAESEATAEVLEALIARVIEAWQSAVPPTINELLGYEITNVEEQVTYEDRDCYDIFAGRRFDEVDCEALTHNIGLLPWLTNKAAVYYLGSICLCDLRNFNGPLYVELEADCSVNLFAHLSDRFQASELFSPAQAEVFRDYIALFARTRGPHTMMFNSSKDLMEWLK
jgi:hypothetical protein